MISCREAAQLISESYDRQLPLRQRVALRLHLLMCSICPRFLQQMLFLKDAAKRYPEETEGKEPAPPLSLTDSAKERIKKALAEGQLRSNPN